jgi:putative transposase
MHLTHKIALDPTPAQEVYFRQACGTARFVWNWALAEWHRRYDAGQTPNAMALKKTFNAIKYIQWPWLKDIHRDAHAQPFAHLAKAWQRFFADRNAGKSTHAPTFKKKGTARDSFYVANDRCSVEGKVITLPKVGKVKLREMLRFTGTILGITVSCLADRWFVSIQVDVPDAQAACERTGSGIVGVDLGVTAAATLSTGEAIASPRPLKMLLRRLRLRSRRHSCKVYGSYNRQKSARTLAKLHYRIANIRADFTHKLTTRLCRESQAVGIEDLHVKGMLANAKLARAISDVGFGAIRQQLVYKAKRYDTRLVVADRRYPSSKMCSHCGYVLDVLPQSVRTWTCPVCDTRHDRDINAARNLAALAALPEAIGKVTPVRYEASQ